MPDSQASAPPQNLEAEESVLGAMMLSPNAIDAVSEEIAAPDFYRASHGKIYDAALALHGRGDPVDPITLVEELEGRGDLDTVGGRVRIYELASLVPATSNAGHYARIVKEMATLRRMLTVGNEITRLAIERPADTPELLDTAEALLTGLGTTNRTQEPILLRDAVRPAYQQIVDLHERGSDIPGLASGWRALDQLTAGFHPGNLIVIAGRPSIGKTSVLTGIAAHVTLRARVPVLLFTLEMNASEVTQRLMAHEGLIDLHRIRTGRLDINDWQNLTPLCEKLEDAPLYIEASSGTTLVELRSKARRLKTRQPDLGLILVDYLQLMTSGKTDESRTQEVSAISRGLKVLAGELNIPVIALSQLNRAVETRHDKRPLLSDLRECVPGSALVYDPATGDRVRADALASTGATVAALDARWRVVKTHASAAWGAGRKPVVRLRTWSGRELVCTTGHRLLTINGWCEAGRLTVGTEVAVPRRLPGPTRPAEVLDARQARLLGYLIADGSYIRHRSVSYTKADPALCSDVISIAKDLFGIDAKVAPARAGCAYEVDLTVTGQGRRNNQLIAWLRELGIHGQIGHEKEVPAALFREGPAITAEFVGALWAGDGTILSRTLRYVTSSERLAFALQHLLLRLGVVSFLSVPYRNKKSRRDLRSVTVSGARQIEAFRSVVPVPGVKGEALAALRFGQRRNERVDRLPLSITNEVATLRATAGLSHSQIGYRTQGKRIGRDNLATVARTLGDDGLAALAVSDVLWDPVKTIVAAGEEDTYDLTVPGLANYVVDDVVTHNSGALEQDADVVMFLYRDEYYHPEDTDQAGIAEVNVAKHRNGPTNTIKLAFRKPYARFTDLHPEPR